MTSPIRCTTEHSGQLERIVLDRPRANILDCEMVAAMRERIAELAASPGPVKLIVFEGAGGNFSYGASVEEHLPGRVEGMLGQFHQLFWELERLSVPTAAIVRGQCLGGGFELALWCGYVACEPSARFGVPEIKLGVFPPMAALTLPWRVRGARSTQIILSGESLAAEEAVLCGVADHCGGRPGVVRPPGAQVRRLPARGVASLAAAARGHFEERHLVAREVLPEGPDVPSRSGRGPFGLPRAPGTGVDRSVRSKP